MARPLAVEPCTHVDVLVEERSMEAALQTLLPRLLGSITFNIHEHRGKPNLLARLPARLRGYANWMPPSWRIAVVVDRDADDEAQLRRRLDQIADDAGLGLQRPVVINRLAIEELEAWYFGDWAAVRGAYPRVPANIPRQAAFRDPDAIAGGTWEAFERVLQGAGYHAGGLPKIAVARAVAEHMDPARNTSTSFCALRDVLAELAIAA